jgi:hypothetical protein
VVFRSPEGKYYQWYYSGRWEGLWNLFKFKYALREFESKKDVAFGWELKEILVFPEVQHLLPIILASSVVYASVQIEIMREEERRVYY